jgi:L-fucose dehydrogenase
MQLNLTKKVIIVSGGAKGIGLGISKVLASEGAIPFIIGRSTEDNLAAVKEIEKMGGQAKCVTAELTNPSECEKAVKQVIAEFGQIDGLINNAGVNDGVGLEKGN